MKTIGRDRLRARLAEAIERFRVTALLGPRQCGKTTLARTFEVPRENYFDLEDPLDEARLKNPRDVLGALNGLGLIAISGPRTAERKSISSSNAKGSSMASNSR